MFKIGSSTSWSSKFLPLSPFLYCSSRSHHAYLDASGPFRWGWLGYHVYCLPEPFLFPVHDLAPHPRNDACYPLTSGSCSNGRACHCHRSPHLQRGPRGNGTRADAPSSRGLGLGASEGAAEHGLRADGELPRQV